MAIPILLDTDIGSDIDDAVCLAYLLSNPECDLLGITTVSGEADKRAALASAICRLAGRDIPIYPGAEQPLLVPQLQPQAPQAEALPRWDHADSFPRGQALAFLREAIRSRPGEITLLTIGPLTNIALLFTVDPELPGMLRSLVMMCGVFTNRLAGVGPLEWNARLDPHATAVVFGHPAPVHRSIGLDVTRQVTMGPEEVQRRFRVGLLRPVLDFAGIWFRQRDHICFHDPLAAATIFDPDICRFRRGNVEVELASERLRGMTHWTLDEAGRHEVALEVHPARFFEHYFSFFPASSASSD